MPPPNDLTTDTPPAPGVDATESHFDDPSVTADGPAPKPAGLPDAPPGYTLEGELGRGGMGIVYLARQQGLNRPVALKMVLAAADGRSLIRFLAEAEAVAAVRHPNVVEVYHFGQHAGRPFLALEFCPGGDLSALTKDGPVEARRAAELLAGVADGVAAAHALGIVHRDLKPHNVLLDDAGQPKVTDFGLAKRVAAGAGLTATVAVMGTPAYMAPEQAAGGTKFVGPPADVWSLGVMLYELLAGERPFSGGDSWAVLGQVMSGKFTPLSAAAPGVPRDLALIVGHCLRRDPRDRYASAVELAADLRAWLSGGTITVRPAGPVETATKWARRNPAVTAALTVALTALTLGTAVSTWQAVRAGAEAVAARAAEKTADDERDAARLAEKKAGEERELARQAEKRATDEGKLARLAEGQAASERNVAVKAEQRAQKQLTRAEWLVYGNQIDLITRSWDDGRPMTSAKTIAMPRRDFRGWEHARLFTATSTTYYELKRHTGLVRAVAFSPDGRRVATASLDGTARLWDAGTGAAAGELKGHTGLVRAVAFSPDGRRVATASLDGTARLWDAGTGAAAGELKGHTGLVTAVAFSPDGRRVATASYDKTARLWDASFSCPFNNCVGHNAVGISVAFSPDGSRYYSKDTSGKRLAWETSSCQPAADDEPVPDFPDAKEAYSPDRQFSMRFEGNTVVFRDEAKWAAFDAEMKRRLAAWAKPDPAWHAAHAAKAVKEEQWFAAAFHLRRLARLTPGDAKLPARLAAAEAMLPKPE